jgi:hypothetical protein
MEKREEDHAEALSLMKEEIVELLFANKLKSRCLLPQQIRTQVHNTEIGEQLPFQPIRCLRFETGLQL